MPPAIAFAQEPEPLNGVPRGDSLDFGDIANDLEMHPALSYRRRAAPRRDPIGGTPWIARRMSSIAATKCGADASSAPDPPVVLFVNSSRPTRGSAAGQGIGVKITLPATIFASSLIGAWFLGSGLGGRVPHWCRTGSWARDPKHYGVREDLREMLMDSNLLPLFVA
jgi:hypothetical protein